MEQLTKEEKAILESTPTQEMPVEGTFEEATKELTEGED